MTALSDQLPMVFMPQLRRRWWARALALAVDPTPSLRATLAPRKLAEAGMEEKRFSRPAVGVVSQLFTQFMPWDQKRRPSGVTSHQRPSTFSARKRPVACKEGPPVQPP